MLINLSNHPHESWLPEQLAAAHNQYGHVVELPHPQIDPDADGKAITELAEEFVKRVLALFDDGRTSPNEYGRCTCEVCADTLSVYGDVFDAVHVAGETSFLVAFVLLWIQWGEPRAYVRPALITASTPREVIEQPDGTKVSRFRFVRFRELT